MQKILIVIPAKNEEKNIEVVLNDLLMHGYKDILVVDDCSDDTTSEKVKNFNVNLISLPFPLGTWGAISTGFLYASKYNYDIVVTMDADGQHPAEEIDKLVKTLIEKKSDLCIGTYFQRYGFLKKAVVKILKLFSGLNYKDILSGFRAYTKSLYTILMDKKFLTIDYQDIGILLIAKDKNMKITEVNVNMKPRLSGKSRVYSNINDILRYLIFTILWSIFKRW